ncbi:dual oxidase maturation factor 1-like isoform X2 [Stegodyphus dumicola]|uniref:dual oxidase maturation factor 1-like isoform X2 n=1 Tax=Stegodyphus dumicola TaxID=202533 RepID=UPI0015A7992E|nr:dual oxidase maturation factor 1-like isoform X2 [Stegodyphus dumicola]
MGSGLFQALREPGRPTYYEENRWPVTADTVVYGIIYGFLAIAFSMYVAIIGIRGVERVYVFTRVTISLFIGAVILVCNFGYGWEYGSVEALTPYKSFVKQQVKANIGLKVGLRGINVTLKGIPKLQINETINYNERFSWEWGQGKPGFGDEAGRLQKEYRAAQRKGLPYPILWTVEYFTIDEGNFRHGRYYRTAGWYCHIALWMAFPLWLLTNILFFMVIRYGAYFLSLTGGCLLLANILFASIRNAVPVEIRFDSKPLVLHYGWCFWLVLFTGLLCEVLVVIIIFMDLRFPEEIAVFFGTNILQDYEDYYVDPAQLGLIPPEVVAGTSSQIDGASQKRSSQEVYTLRKRTMSTRFQRSSQRHPNPMPRQRIAKGQTKRASELPVYENLSLMRRNFADLHNAYSYKTFENSKEQEL